MKTNFLLVLIFGFLFSSAQDTLTNSPKPGYKKWTEMRTVMRFAAGIQESTYVELGIARHRFYFNDLGSTSAAYYAAFEWTPIQNIYSLKGGYEMTARAIALGIEAKYQTDLLHGDAVITPKIGLGVMGIVNVFYGLNISFLNLPFSSIGRHQFSIVLNYNKLAFHKSGASRKLPASSAGP